MDFYTKSNNTKNEKAQNLILIGAGGHSKSVADSIQPEQFNLCGFLDENRTGSHLGLPIFGKNIEDIPNYENYVYFISIGDVVARKSWFNRIKSFGLTIVNIIDSTAVIAQSVVIGEGNFIGKHAVINADAVVGDNNVINTKALVEHECFVGNHTHLSTNSTINGNVTVHDGVFLGSSSVCNGQLEIGEYAIIGSGTVIIRDVEPHTTVVGVPGRVIKRRNPNG